MLKYAQVKDSGYRALGIGCMADLSDSMGSALTPYVKELIPLALSSCSDPFEEVRSNGAYFVGVLIQSGSKNSQFLARCSKSNFPSF